MATLLWVIEESCLKCFWVCFLSSIHLRVEEKISLTCGRDGGLQNMEVLGMVTLRVTDDKNGRIRLIINNNDNKGLQLQVGPPHIIIDVCCRQCYAIQQYSL